MNAAIHGLTTLERVTPDDAHYFFGYYDTPGWSQSGRFHLCHKVDFVDRLPRAGDTAVLGLIDVADRTFHPIAETTAWNFQQGSMLQWHPKLAEDVVIYNVRDGEDYRACVHQIRTGAVRQLERPVANVDPAGLYAVSVNFDRLFDFRPGYGYAGTKDRFFKDPHSEEDGIFLVDLQTGLSRLVLSMQRIWEATQAFFHGEDQKLLINHITFNTDGSRLVFLVRNFTEEGRGWKTAVMTVNPDGSDLFLLSDYSYASHYCWRDARHIAFHSRGAEVGDAGDQLYLFKDKTYEGEAIDPGFFLRDGHCSYSPDRKMMLYDSYPDKRHMRHLYVYDLEKRKGVTLGSFHSPPGIDGDIRCDLHPRWDRNGTRISFDSVHEGRRGLYVMDLRNVLRHGI
ncbi:hypothetical protein PAESOLCIP111_05317 [Paenibacillus solanacearum]|uniref:Uncharacterized protein n=1 Tax=Paenibacillus solanacearum TaxID=2048548 RepID=A0A916K945_9BACL|nr:hypothetical protein [Paenibacillus solanacearum]CAG7647125.1 hypothetical protein PAESOLCIP111_05317 [Paenibacillus solanacearum]